MPLTIEGQHLGALRFGIQTRAIAEAQAAMSRNGLLIGRARAGAGHRAADAVHDLAHEGPAPHRRGQPATRGWRLRHRDPRQPGARGAPGVRRVQAHGPGRARARGLPPLADRDSHRRPDGHRREDPAGARPQRGRAAAMYRTSRSRVSRPEGAVPGPAAAAPRRHRTCRSTNAHPPRPRHRRAGAQPHRQHPAARTAQSVWCSSTCRRCSAAGRRTLCRGDLTSPT